MAELASMAPVGSAAESRSRFSGSGGCVYVTVPLNVGLVSVPFVASAFEPNSVFHWLAVGIKPKDHPGLLCANAVPDKANTETLDKKRSFFIPLNDPIVR